jgi:hypothetical protein
MTRNDSELRLATLSERRIADLPAGQPQRFNPGQSAGPGFYLARRAWQGPRPVSQPKATRTTRIRLVGGMAAAMGLGLVLLVLLVLL